MAASFAIRHDQGARVWLPFTYWQDDAKTQPNNLTGFTARLQVREGIADDGFAVVAEFTSADGTILIGGTAADPTNGQVVIDSGSDVALVSFPAGAYVYDLYLYAADGTPDRLVEGTWTQRGQVTLPA